MIHRASAAPPKAVVKAWVEEMGIPFHQAPRAQAVETSSPTANAMETTSRRMRSHTLLRRHQGRAVATSDTTTRLSWPPDIRPLPVDDTVRHWVASPDAAVGFLIHAATMDTAPLGARRCLTMPGLCVSITEMIEALRAVAGDEAVARIRREPDATIRGIVAGWPQDFAPDRALAAGFTADPDFQSIIRAHIRDTADAAG